MGEAVSHRKGRWLGQFFLFILCVWECLILDKKDKRNKKEQEKQEGQD